MPDDKGQLFLYEALELRSEYDARLKTLRECLPEARRNRDRLTFTRTEEAQYRPAPEFDAAKIREEIKGLENRRRKLNAAIQQANFENIVEYGGEQVRLAEALESRKALNDKLGEFHSQVAQSAYERVIYKEDRDIVESPDIPFDTALQQLDEARREFRDLNRKLRAASFSVVVDYRDE